MTAFLHTDHLATPRYGTSAAGSTVWTWDSGAFGKEAPTGSATVNLRFPGQYFDSETTLFYNWNRFYNPATGRYVSSDPIGLVGGLATYNYVSVSPVMFSDPEGLTDGGVLEAGTISCLTGPNPYCIASVTVAGIGLVTVVCTLNDCPAAIQRAIDSIVNGVNAAVEWCMGLFGGTTSESTQGNNGEGGDDKPNVLPFPEDKINNKDKTGPVVANDNQRYFCELVGSYDPVPTLGSCHYKCSNSPELIIKFKHRGDIVNGVPLEPGKPCPNPAYNLAGP